MTTGNTSRARWWSIGGLAVACLARSLSAQDPPQRVGLPEDWSHRHLVFSNPGTFVQMLDKGVSQQRWWNWLAVQREARFSMQQAKRNRGRGFHAGNARFVDSFRQRVGRPPTRRPPKMQRDWNIGLGDKSPVAMYPAKFTFDVNSTPDCLNDFVVFPISAGGAAQAKLIAFNNLYRPGLCGTATTPAFKFAYQIGSGVVQTSPVLSLDGAKVAFVESINGNSKFHVLTIGTTGTNGNSTGGVAVGAGGGNNAVDTSLTMIGGVRVTRSSPFIDYAADAAFVGDDDGRLHKFTGVFKGTLAEAGAPWPASVGNATILTGPVAYNGKVFVAGDNGNLYCVTADGLGCSPASSIAVGTVAILDPPIVDGSTNQIFVATENATNSILVQVPTSLASATTVLMGNDTASGFDIHNGAFDHNYLTGANPSAGFMYFCGVHSLQTAPTLYRVGFNAAGQVNGVRDTHEFVLTQFSNDRDDCSPLTEIYNPNAAGGPTDMLFVTIAKNNLGCSGLSLNCVASFDITSAFPIDFHAVFPLGGSGLGTTAIVVDNVADVVPRWQASTAYALDTLIVDSNGNVQQCTTPGTSRGSGRPTWNTTVESTTTDDAVTWTMLGPYKGSWQASRAYSLNDVITDFDNPFTDHHLQRATTAGMSGASPPVFNATTGGTTTDNTATWTNLGPSTPSGVSNVYFSDVKSNLAYKLTQSGLK